MEDNNRLVKVYSNNSKKARLKRNKNKFQRIWDAEKQTYIKVRKAKYPVRNATTKKQEDVEAKLALIKKRQATAKKPKKSVPVNTQKAKTVSVHKPETTQSVRKEPARISGKTNTNTLNINGVKHIWDSKNLCYKRAA